MVTYANNNLFSNPLDITPNDNVIMHLSHRKEPPMTNVEKYFKQKNWSVPEIICIVAMMVAIVFIIAISIPIGVPLGGVAVIVLVFIKSAKIKDAEVDHALEAILQAHEITLDPQSTIATYDLKGARIVKGRDGKFRSECHVVTVIDLGRETKEITVYRIELLTGRVQQENYTLAYTEAVLLQEEAVMTSSGRKTVRFLINPAFKSPVPVSTDDMDASKLVEKITQTP